MLFRRKPSPAVKPVGDQMEIWIFAAHGADHLVGLGNEANARQYASALNMHRVLNRFEHRRPSVDEAERISRRPVESIFRIADELAKIRS
jgi:hypothetical protein